MKILITGGAGYIGTALTDNLLKAGHKVTVYDSLQYGIGSLSEFFKNKRFNLKIGDIKEYNNVGPAMSDSDCVVHLAAVVGLDPCHANPELAKEINVDATKNLLEISEFYGVNRFIFASTCSIYGNTEGKLADENSEVIPISEYGITKYEAEQAVVNCNSKNLETCALRFATATGPSRRMRFDLLPSEFVHDAYRCKPTTLKYWDSFRPYMDVRDIASAIKSVVEADSRKISGEIFNVADERQNFTKEDLVKMIQVHFPEWQVIYNQDKISGDKRNYQTTGRKISDTLGFEREYPIDRSIVDVIELIESKCRKKR